MSNEDFQKLVLEKLSSIESDIKVMKKDIAGIKEQTANLTEFKTVVKQAGEILYKNIS